MTRIPSRQLEQAYDRLMDRADRSHGPVLATVGYGRGWMLEAVNHPERGGRVQLVHYGTPILTVSGGRCVQVLCTSKSDRDAINGLARMLSGRGLLRDRVSARFEDGYPVATVNGVHPDTPRGWFQDPLRIAERDIQGARGCERCLPPCPRATPAPSGASRTRTMRRPHCSRALRTCHGAIPTGSARGCPRT